MNIDKVNSVLSKALTRIQEGEAQSLRDLVVADAEMVEEPSAFESLIGDFVDKLVAECQVEDAAAVEAIVEVAGTLADEGKLPEIFGVDEPSEQDINAWMEAVENSDLVEAAIQHLAS